MAQNDTGVRVGRVSSINYQAGTARVVFGDKDSAVTKEVPFVSNNEYNMPLVGDLVQVSHNSNGTMAATIPGSTWNQNNKPYEGGRGIFRKEYSNTKNKCFERFNDNTGEFMRRVPGLLLYQSRETYMEATGKAGLTGGGAVTVTSTGASVGVQAKSGVGLNAGRDVSLDAGADISGEAGGSISLSARKKWMRTVGGTATDTITGAATALYKARRSVTVTGAAVDTYKGAWTIGAKSRVSATINGSLSLIAKASSTLQFKSRVNVNIKGNLTRTVKGKVTDTITGDVKQSIKGDVQQKIDGDTKLEVTGNLEVKVGGTTIKATSGGNVTVTAAATCTVNSPIVTIEGGTGDVKVNGISLVHHKHKDGGQGEPEK